ncbi:GntR family transcriptional regulator [Dictyobacter aurantiacus]|uniref:Putative transcription regulator n=1 Tax=Dictyobacter aurantiacus TaxID=1936993 RepID=A0A401ZPT3_9CHLR|nr:GntR family transcriptional regulator [Dictyobacter aurantiacus]GCE08766.1 putative transcription regulator [Dictyobacter aurantiacus]
MLPLYEQVYQHLLSEIKSGRLRGGDRVPSEKELAEQFNVSRITSKKALENLMQAQLVERIRGKGTFVVQTLPDLQEIAHPHSSEVLSASNEHARHDYALIGVIIEDVADSYGLRLLQSIEESCSQHKMYMLLKRTYGKREEEEAAIEAFLQLGVDGLIIFPVHGDYYNPKILKLVVDNFPVVLVDRYLKGVAAHAVYTDNRKAAYDLTVYLLEQGHQHIAFVSPPLENTSSIDERLQGFSAALTDHGVSLNSNYWFTRLVSTLPAVYRRENAFTDQQELTRFIQENPEITAFFTCEYSQAMLLRHTLLTMDRPKVPQPTIVCFDYPEQLFVSPLFTHIQQDEIAMGRQAIEVLRGQIEGQREPLVSVIPYTLIRAD